MTFMEDVFLACRRIPKGRVSTYSQIAKAIGRPKASRAVGNALSKNRSPSVPCHRVIRSDLHVGGFAFGTKKKVGMLKAEGIRIEKGMVLQEYLLGK